MKSIVKNSLALTLILIGSNAFSQTETKTAPMKQEPLKKVEITNPPQKTVKKGVVARKASPVKRELTPIPAKKEE